MPIKSNDDLIHIARFARSMINGRSCRKRWATFKNLIVQLAIYHGYIKTGMTWNMIPELSIDIALKSKSKALQANRDTGRRNLTLTSALRS